MSQKEYATVQYPTVLKYFLHYVCLHKYTVASNN